MSARVEISRTAQMETLIQIYLTDQFEVEAIKGAIDLAKVELAKRIWEENEAKILAQMDLKGLANLIALKACQELKR